MTSASGKISPGSARGRDWQFRRRSPLYDPTTDTGLKLWLDPTDTATLTAAGGGGITNGATIGSWASKAGTARSFTQWGANARPTWDSAGINGLAAVRTNTQILTTQTVMGDFASMSGLTVMAVGKNSAGAGILIASTMLDIGTGKKDIVQFQLNLGTTYAGGGRRARGDAFQSILGDATPSVFVEAVVFDYSNAKISLYQSGTEGKLNQTFQTAGTTDAADPFAISVGAFAQESFTAAATFANGWIGEIYLWLTAKTPDDLVPPHDHLRRRWGGGLL